MARFEKFWTVMCDYRDFLWLGVMVLIFLFILNVISLLWVRPGSASFVVAIINTVMLVLAGGVVGGMYWTCMRRQTDVY